MTTLIDIKKALPIQHFRGLPFVKKGYFGYLDNREIYTYQYFRETVTKVTKVTFYSTKKNICIYKIIYYITLI